MNDIRAFVDREIVPHADGFDADGKLPRTLVDSLAADELPS